MTDILNAEKLEQIRGDVTSNMKAFTKDFLSLYKASLVKSMLEDGGSGGDSGDGDADKEGGDSAEAEAGDDAEKQEQEGGEEERQLLVRPEPEGGSKEPLFTATMTKRGQVRKNWKERFFVVRPDYVIEYYESEDKYKSGGSPKGTINLCGYTVFTEPNKRKQEEKEELAKLFGAGGAVGEYTKYEPLTLECYHRVKRRWLIKCNDEAQFKQWADILRMCARYVDAGTLKDPLMKDAFDQASRNLSARLFEQRIWGSEVDILTHMLANDTWRRRVGDAAFKDAPGPAAIKAKAATKGYETVYRTVETAVKASWTATVAGANKAKDLAQNSFSSVVEKAQSTQDSLTDKVSEAVEPAVAPIKDKVIVPVCTKVAAFIVPRTRAPVESVDPVLETETEAYCEERATGGNPTMRNLKRTHEKMESPMEAFSTLESALTCDELMGLIPDGVTSVVDNVSEVIEKLQLRDFVMALREATFENAERAAYTFEVELEDATNGDHSQAQDKRDIVLTQVKEKYHHDARMDVAETVGEFLGNLVNALVGDKLAEACGSAVEPLDSLIPEVLQDFFSVSGILEDVLSGIIETAASEAVEAAMKSSD